ncbi:hypothetical protein [Halomonas mongoliensis]
MVVAGAQRQNASVKSLENPAGIGNRRQGKEFPQALCLGGNGI